MTLAALTTSVMAESSQWFKKDPGSYISKDASLGWWTDKDYLPKSQSIEGKGAYHLCPIGTKGNECSYGYNESVSAQWAYATAVTVSVNVGVSDSLSVGASVTNTVTYTTTDSFTNESGIKISGGRTAQFIAIMPRMENYRKLKGRMFDTGKTKRISTDHLCCVLHYYYEWQPSEWVSSINGKQQRRDKPVWTWAINGVVPSV